MNTIGVPTYNRAKVLKKTIHSLLNIKNKENIEIVIIDNNSKDDTEAICLAMLSGYGKYYKELKQGVSHARNRIFQEAKGDLILFTDDDGSPDPNWVIEMIKVADAHPDVGVFMGRTENEWEVPYPKWFKDDPNHKIVFNYRHDLGSEVCEIPPGHYPAGPNMAVRRWVYEKIGGFNPEFGIIGGKKIGGEEIDFAWRARRSGIKGMYVPKALVYHRVHGNLATLRSLFKGSWAAGLSDSILIRAYPEQYGSALGRKFLGMPMWWWKRLAISPWQNLGHFVYHIMRGEKTAAVHHLLALIRWAARIRYLLLWRGVAEKMAAAQNPALNTANNQG